MNEQGLHILFFKLTEFHGQTSFYPERCHVDFFSVDCIHGFSRFLLQLVGILLEDIVTKQLKVDMNEQQHTFYCQELGTLLMCLIHIFKSGNTLNNALCCSMHWQGGFSVLRQLLNALNYWEGIHRCWRHFILLGIKNLPNFVLVHAGHIFSHFFCLRRTKRN